MRSLLTRRNPCHYESVVLSPKVKSDLSDIWDYPLAEWGIDQAEKYVRELWAAMQDQALDASTSADISDVRKGYRKVRFYPPNKGGCDIG